MNYTFNNSSIVSVNSGTIVLNVSGKTRTFVDAKLVSAVDGKIVLDLPCPILTEGAYLTVHLDYDDTAPQRTFIAKRDNTDVINIFYHVSQCRVGIKYTSNWQRISPHRNATPEEIQELNDQLAAEGKRWNPKTMQIEKLRWKPKKGEPYFNIQIAKGTAEISHYSWDEDELDKDLYKMGNCFKTKKEAEAKLEQIKKILLQN